MNNNINYYDLFSKVYDRFVNWEQRLEVELPFLIAELSTAQGNFDRVPRILDSACGTGQHSIAMKMAGFDVTGADASPEMVQAANVNAHSAHLDIPFVVAGFGQLVDAFGEKSFDGLICLGNSLPHVLDNDFLIKTLKDFQFVLRPGGKLIIQNRNFDSVLRTQNRWMEPQTFREGRNSWVFIRFYDFEKDGTITFNIVILSDEGQQSFNQQNIRLRLRPWKKDELVRCLTETGFSDIHLYGDLQGSPFDAESSGNLVVTANVPG